MLQEIQYSFQQAPPVKASIYALDILAFTEGGACSGDYGKYLGITKQQHPTWKLWRLRSTHARLAAPDHNATARQPDYIPQYQQHDTIQPNTSLLTHSCQGEYLKYSTALQRKRYTVVETSRCNYGFTVHVQASTPPVKASISRGEMLSFTGERTE